MQKLHMCVIFFVVFYPSFKPSVGVVKNELMPRAFHSLWSTWRDSRWLEYTVHIVFFDFESKDYLCSVSLGVY